MWFTERIGNTRWQISYAESLDGVNWSKSPKNPIIAPFYNKLIAKFFEAVAKFTGLCGEIPLYGIASPFVWKDGEKYLLVGHEVGRRGKLYIPMYESRDGLLWKKLKNNILPEPSSEWNKFFQADPFIYVEN